MTAHSGGACPDHLVERALQERAVERLGDQRDGAIGTGNGSAWGAAVEGVGHAHAPALEVIAQRIAEAAAQHDIEYCRIDLRLLEHLGRCSDAVGGSDWFVSGLPKELADIADDEEIVLDHQHFRF